MNSSRNQIVPSSKHRDDWELTKGTPTTQQYCGGC
jgi:hypothetical protein